MSRRSRLFALSIVILAAGAAAARAQTADDLFDPGTVKEIRLYIHSRDWSAMRSRYLENIYFPGDLHWGDLRARNVGIRIRGSGSRSATKPGLQLDFDRYVTDGRFLGMRSLVLDNLLQDPSMMHEFVSMAVFARLGRPSSREAFVRVYVNNVHYGLYTVVEAVEPELLRRTLGDDGGYLFEFHWLARYDAEDLGDDLEPYRARLEARTHRLEPDVVLYSPIRELIREANQPVDDLWRERVGRYLDLRAFVSHLAIEAFVSQWDGFLGYDGMNNFYLYRSRDSDVHQLIPWDLDVAMTDLTQPVFTRVDVNPLSRGALSFPDLRAHFLEVLRECVRLSREDDWLTTLVSQTSALIRPFAHADPWKPWTNDEVDAALNQMAEYAALRPDVVEREIVEVERSR